VTGFRRMCMYLQSFNVNTVDKIKICKEKDKEMRVPWCYVLAFILGPNLAAITR
jgi:hypothetical protein